MNILELEKEKQSISRQLQQVEAEYKSATEQLSKQLKQVNINLDLLNGNYNIEYIDIARKIITVYGGMRSLYGDGLEMVNKAKDDIINGPRLLNTEYVGTKDYSGFSCQGIVCKYGMGPKHGRVVFSIELVKERRNTELTAQEKNAVLYYLNNIFEISKIMS